MIYALAILSLATSASRTTSMRLSAVEIPETPTTPGPEIDIAATADNDLRRQKNCALCLIGGISRRTHDLNIERSVSASKLADYINFFSVWNATQRHIIHHNQNFCSFKVFMHSWEVGLKNIFSKLYQPEVMLVENNSIYEEEISKRFTSSWKHRSAYSHLSAALSRKKCLTLVKEYEKEGLNNSFDVVVTYRPDVLLWKDMKLAPKLPSLRTNIYVNGYTGGDFHFIMNSINAQRFSKLYDYGFNGGFVAKHAWIGHYIKTQMKMSITPDDIFPGRDQEVIGK